MTSRRSIQTPAERMSRALQFVPGHVGGRVASAQPIRRRGGTLRRASVGAADVELYLDPPTFDSMVMGGPDSGAFGYQAAYWDFSMPISNGDVAVAMIVGPDGVTPPDAGWTSVDSGTVGSLVWSVWHTVVTDDTWNRFTRDLSGSPTIGALYMFTGPDAAAWGVPTVTATTAAASLSQDYPAPLGLVGEMTFLATLYHHDTILNDEDTVWEAFNSWDPDVTAFTPTSKGKFYGDRADEWYVHYGHLDDPDAQDTTPRTVTVSVPDAVNYPLTANPDWLLLNVGWA